VARIFPSGSKARHRTLLLCAFQVSISSPVHVPDQDSSLARARGASEAVRGERD
jgi:hypothetical protein